MTSKLSMILSALALAACAPGQLAGGELAFDQELERFATSRRGGESLAATCKRFGERCQRNGQDCGAYNAICGGSEAEICARLKNACSSHPRACTLYARSCQAGTPGKPVPSGDAGAGAPSSDAGAPPAKPPAKPDSSTPSADSSSGAPPPPPPASGTCSYPSGDPPGAKVIDNQKLKAGQVLENFILRSSGGHAINPPNVQNTTVRNGSVYANGGDNIKLGDNSTYRNLYLDMSTSGGHIDALQGQAATGVTIENVTVKMQGHSGVTGAILFQTLKGGGGGWSNHVTFTLNCIKLIGEGPYGNDIRVDYKDGGSVSGRITNIQMTGKILITDRGGGGSCRIEADKTALPHIKSSGCTIVPI